MDFRTCQRKLSCELDVFKSSQEIEEQLDGLNVEDGLSAKDNETFLLASMAFLQQHAKRKLGVIAEEEPSDMEPENKKYKSNYSNMLLFESHTGNQRDRFYIKLKNYEKFDSMMKSETSIPVGPVASTLSWERIFPKVKNPKKFAKLFQTTSKTSIFNLFRKRNKPPETREHDEETADVREPHNDWNFEMKQKCLSQYRHQQEEQLKFVSGLNNEEDNLLIKASVHRKLRVRQTDSITTVEQFLLDEEEEENGRLPNVYGRDGNGRTSLKSYPSYQEKVEMRKKLTRPQSKISVCLEDESDSEYNSTSRSDKSKSSKSNKFSNKMSAYSNFSDELKANLSPEVLQNIISEMITFLEETPSTKGSVH